MGDDEILVFQPLEEQRQTDTTLFSDFVNSVNAGVQERRTLFFDLDSEKLTNLLGIKDVLMSYSQDERGQIQLDYYNSGLQARDRRPSASQT
ncbi:MAG: hypothetical protein K2Z81_05495, partial [Cyanobacteria bacterium]|nr:hypothetical protein [Cyanobacteriota bacterium]